jgi:GTP-binding protein
VQIPFAVVFTKADAAKKKAPTPGANMKAFKEGLLQNWEDLPACFATSAKQGKGRSEVLTYLASLRKLEEEST